MKDLLYTLGYVSIYSAFSPVFAFFIVRARHALTLTIVSLSLISFAFDIANRIMVSSGYRGHEMANIFFFVQFLLLSYVFAQLITNNRLIYFALTLFTGLALYITLKIQGINEYQSWTRGVGSIFLLGYCALYYRQLLKTMPTDDLMKFAPFWITLAVFIYFGFNLALFIMANYIFKDMPNEAAMVFWSSHNVSNIIKNIFFTIAIYHGGNLIYLR